MDARIVQLLRLFVTDVTVDTTPLCFDLWKISVAMICSYNLLKYLNLSGWREIFLATVYIKQNEIPSFHTTKMKLFEHEHLHKIVLQCLELQKLIRNELTLTQ